MIHSEKAYRSLSWLGVCALLWAGCSQAAPNDPSRGGDNAGSGGGVAGAAGPGGASGSGASGSGASGSGGLAGSGGAAEADYYQLTEGASWTYRHVGGSSTWDEVVMQSATQYQGASAVLLIDNAGPSGSHSETVLQAEGTRISRVFRDELIGSTIELSTEYDPGFLRYDRAWEDESPGYAQTYTYARVEFDGTGQVVGEAERSHTFTVEALNDSVTVPAGTIEQCLRVRRERVRGSGDAPADDDVDLFWFCAGIGKVLEENQATGEREELVACDVPGGNCP
jgi:hypothetical protein